MRLEEKKTKPEAPKPDEALPEGALDAASGGVAEAPDGSDDSIHFPHI